MPSTVRSSPGCFVPLDMQIRQIPSPPPAPHTQGDPHRGSSRRPRDLHPRQAAIHWIASGCFFRISSIRRSVVLRVTFNDLSHVFFCGLNGFMKGTEENSL